jgi:hypothetical protein
MIASALEVVSLISGFTSLSKRSGALDGNLPVRAARYCGPVFDGSAAGFQVMMPQPITIERDRRGSIQCTMTDPALKQVTEEVDDALAKGVKAGLIEEHGFWHKMFRGNALPTYKRRLLFWTGHMVRPRGGIWLLVGGAFNRRSRISVVDHLVTDPHRFVPLVIEIDTRDVGSEPIWLESEIGCVTPLVPAVRIQKQAASAGAPEVREFATFYSEEYFATKDQHPTAKYVRCQREHRVKTEASCPARLVYAGPDVHEVREFDRFIASDGFEKVANSAGVMQFAVIRNVAPTHWHWQGQTHSTFEVKKARHLTELDKLWRDTVGDAHPSAFEFLSAYLLGESWDQPFVQFQPWAFLPTAPGWSTVVDGYHGAPAYDGMRGVIATDWFHSLAMVYRMYGPAKVRLPFRAPMLRAVPVTRAALDLGMKESSI